jgi:apolipoprotein N-acyltransferase
MLYGIIPSMLGLLTYILTLYYAILWFLPYLAYQLLYRRNPGFIGTLIFPLSAVGVDYLNTVLFGSWGSVAYTQLPNLPLVQIASITGMWGVTFLVMWFGSFFNWLWDQKFQWSKVKRDCLVYAGVISIVLIYGGLRLGVLYPPSETVRVGSLTPSQELEKIYDELKMIGFSSSLDAAIEDRESLRQILNITYEDVFERTREVARSGVSFVMWPEGMINVLEESEAAFIDEGRNLAQSEKIYFLMAYLVIPEKNPRVLGKNKSVFIDPEGDVEWEYLKAHPVPGSTDKAGDRILPLSKTPYGRVSSVICYDMDFTGLLHQAGKARVDIMLVPAWDWKAIDPLHAHMAVFRAIENGFSMVRQTGKGLSIAVDYLGRTQAVMDHFTSTRKIMIAEIPRKGISTFYAQMGDYFAWLCVAGLLVLVVWSSVRRSSKP